MIQFKTGNLFGSSAEAIVNAVNCVGVMGRGIALQFKERFPKNFEVYVRACRQGRVYPGRMFVFKTGGQGNLRYIINFPTKRHWRDKSYLEDIDVGLDDLVNVVRECSIQSVALPAIGSGLGGLKWDVVRSLIQDKLSDLEDVDVEVFGPGERLEIEGRVEGNYGQDI